MDNKPHLSIVSGGIIALFSCLLQVQGAQPLLFNPAKRDRQFEFDLLVQSKTQLVIEQTTDWLTWTPVWTNQAEYPSMHHASISTSSALVFFRAKQLPSSMFRFAMVSQQAILFNGNDYVIDSFDSSDPIWSTNGAYDAAKHKDRGDVAVWEGVTNVMTASSLEMYGHILTKPAAPLVLGANSSVGSSAWISSNNKGIQPGYRHEDLNLEMVDIEPPFTGGAFVPTSGAIEGRFYKYVLGSGNYQMSALHMNNNDAMVVTGQTVLFVTSEVFLSGASFIEILDGAHLKLYMGGGSATFSGEDFINHSGKASAFTYFGLATNTNVVWEGMQRFEGVIWAPRADLTFNNSNNSASDIVGACAARSIRLNGDHRFHYDEDLGRMTE